MSLPVQSAPNRTDEENKEYYNSIAERCEEEAEKRIAEIKDKVEAVLKDIE